MKLSSTAYKFFFWLAIIIIIVLAVVLTRMINKPAENVSYIDLNNDSSENSLINNATPAVETVNEIKNDAAVEEKKTETKTEETTETKETIKESTLNVITVKEGDLVSFPNLKVEDADNDKITFTFSSPLNAKGEWQTKMGDAGNYQINITASDGKDSVVEKVMIIVEKLNNAPIIEFADKATVNEGDMIKLEPVISDPDGDALEISYSGWMKSSSKQTTYDDAGVHEVTIKASDGISTTEKKVSVIVENVNRKPEFVSII